MKSTTPYTALTVALLATAGAAHALDSGDRYAIDQAAQHSLEYARTDEATGWINPDTGTEGTFTPVATHEGPDGQVCREYSVTAIIAGREEQVYGIACRQPDGTWIEANPARPQAAAPAPNPVVYAPTTVTYPWWGFLSSFAFSGSYCDDGFCFGGRYGYSYPYSYYYPYGYPYGYGYYPYRFGFSYSYYDYDYDYRDYHRRRHHYRHHGKYRNHGKYRDHGKRDHRYDGRDYDDRRSGHQTRSGDFRSDRSKSTHPRNNRSHDRRSMDSRSRGDHSRGDRSRSNRSGISRMARVSRDR